MTIISKLLFIVRLSSPDLECIFSSFIPKSYKKNLITCLVTRAFRICSHSTTFDIELEFLRDFFLKNGFPINFINKMFRCTLEKIHKPFDQLTTVPKKKKNLFLHYLDGISLRNTQEEAFSNYKDILSAVRAKICLQK